MVQGDRDFLIDCLFGPSAALASPAAPSASAASSSDSGSDSESDSESEPPEGRDWLDAAAISLSESDYVPSDASSDYGAGSDSEPEIIDISN